MKKITIVVALIFSLGIMFTSCNETKKEIKKEATEQVQGAEKATKEVKEEVTEHNHSEEMAMATYQCPMKCEGDKTYAEAGTCPKCKMDLKEVKKDTDNTTSNHEEEHDDDHEH